MLYFLRFLLLFTRLSSYMRVIFFVFLTILGLSNCAKKTTNLALKDYQSLEGIRIGMPIKDALKVLDKKYIVEKKLVKILDEEPESIDYLVTNKKKEALFTFNAGYEKSNKNNVFRIVIKSPLYSTPDGVSVGMTVKDLKSKSTLKSADFNFQDGLYLISAKFDGGFWIHTDPKKQYRFNYEKPALKDIPDDLKIKGIVLF
jgi:hypothetical protein